MKKKNIFQNFGMLVPLTDQVSMRHQGSPDLFFTKCILLLRLNKYVDNQLFLLQSKLQ